MLNLPFSNLDLFSVGVAIVATLILGFVLFLSDKKNVTNRSFFIFCIVTAIWSVINYFNYKIDSGEITLWLIRFVLFFAIWQAFTLFQLLLVFPEKEFIFDKNFKKVLLPVTILVSLFCLTPYVISGAPARYTEQASKVNVQPGILTFGALAVALVSMAVYLLIKKIRQSSGKERKPFVYVLLGFILMFGLIISFNFILAAFFGVYKFIPYGAVFTFPFIIFTSYAIFRHNLLNIKIVSTEILVFVLSVVSLIEIIVSDSIGILVLRVSIFILLVSLGIVLIRSVRKEIEQKEELQILSKELEKVNNELKDLDKARADFITIASHQLRTPPATIKWYVAAILSGDFGELVPDVKTQLTKVQATNNSQISLIDDMLNASRIERGKMEFLFEEVEVEPMAKMTYDQLMPLAGMKGIKLVYNPPKTPLPKVMADIEKLRQVMNNFIDNAIKYTEKGVITAELFQEGDNIRYQVTDNGMGIKPELAPHLFNKYSRGQDSVTHAQGLGLGLYVCKMVVEQHRGKIWAESPGEGKGSTFIFTIPIHNNLKATTLVDLGKMEVK